MHLGDRMKLYEELSGSLPKLFPLLPAHARLDGKCFSTFTRGLATPYDERLTKLMVAVTTSLVDHFAASIGYTQSDEISLLWYSDDIKSQIPHDGRRDKLNTDLATFCCNEFNRLLPDHLPEKVNKTRIPQFDCRVWNTPTIAEAANSFLWRERDATRNSILSSGAKYYSHKQLFKKNITEIQNMLHQKGVNWNDYPNFFKRGTFVQRRKEITKFSTDEIDRLPAKHLARSNPDLEIERSVVKVVDSVPPFPEITNKAGFIFHGEYPSKKPEV